MGFFNKLFGKTSPQDEFANTVMAAIKAIDPDAELGYKSGDAFMTVDRDAGLSVLPVADAFQNYSGASDEEKSKLIEDLAAAHTRVEEDITLDMVRDNLLPRVRSRTLMPLRMLSFGALTADERKKLEVPDAKLADRLSLSVAIDSISSIMDVKPAMLERWGLSFDEALAIAQDNLRKVSEPEFDAIQPGLYMACWSDDYVSARLCLPEMFEGLNIMGQPVAAVPSKTVLMVAGDQDKKALQALLEAVEIGLETEEEPIIDGGLIRYDGRQWSSYVPDDKTLADQAEWLRVTSDSMTYNKQIDVLTKLMSHRDDPVFVASCMIFNEGDGKRVSTSTWTEGVDTLLPRTETVSLLSDPDDQGNEQPVIIVNWIDMIDVMGAAVEAMDCDPPRFRVREFPNKDQFEMLRKRARVEVEPSD